MQWVRLHFLEVQCILLSVEHQEVQKASLLDYVRHLFYSFLFQEFIYACPLGKLNPEISIKRNNVGRSRSKIFFSKGFNIVWAMVCLSLMLVAYLMLKRYKIEALFFVITMSLCSTLSNIHCTSKK
jgi:hypothetical protein